ncbi:MAG: response regulator [Sphingomonadaceae bacterium]
MGTINERADVAAQVKPAAPAVRRCLIVDDSRMIRRLSRDIIASHGYQVSEAEDGEEALARIKAEGMPDLIVIDWNMPVMTGLQCVKALRQVAGNTWPKIMFCTTNDDPADIHKGIEAGASDWVVKPFDRAAMEAKLEKIGAI